MGTTHHDGVSVYGSSLFYGKKNVEVPFFGGTSGLAGAGGTRCDGGTFGVSGQILSVSTRLSSIYYVLAQIGRPLVSGLMGTNVVASGNSFDVYTNYVNVSTVNASTTTAIAAVASVSTPIYWFAAGI